MSVSTPDNTINPNITNPNNTNPNNTNIIDYIKNFKFYKWCNCERTNNKIMVKCYDYPLEAIEAHEKEHEHEASQPNYNFHIKDVKLLPIFKYMPAFIQKNSIQKQFNCPVIFDFPTVDNICNVENKP